MHKKSTRQENNFEIISLSITTVEKEVQNYFINAKPAQ